jgi:para-nitrobenzyl esterase
MVLVALAVHAMTLTLVACRRADNPLNTIKIDASQIEGVGSGDILSFKGIPYAAPPVGDLRWREPQPVKPWHGMTNDQWKIGHRSPGFLNHSHPQFDN